MRSNGAGLHAYCDITLGLHDLHVILVYSVSAKTKQNLFRHLLLMDSEIWRSGWHASHFSVTSKQRVIHCMSTGIGYRFFLNF